MPHVSLFNAGGDGEVQIEELRGEVMLGGDAVGGVACDRLDRCRSDAVMKK
jgi:hypothetical protein